MKKMSNCISSYFCVCSHEAEIKDVTFRFEVTQSGEGRNGTGHSIRKHNLLPFVLPRRSVLPVSLSLFLHFDSLITLKDDLPMDRHLRDDFHFATFFKVTYVCNIALYFVCFYFRKQFLLNPVFLCPYYL